MSVTSNLGDHFAPQAPSHKVPLLQPFTWVARGWNDLMHHRGASLAYGWLVSTLGVLILAYERHPLFVAAAISGFLLVGPIMTAGMCELSRRQGRHQRANFDTSLKALQRHRTALLRVANTLLLISVAWFVFSSMVLYGTLDTFVPSLAETIHGDVLARLSTTQIVAYVVSGGILACIVFSLSVVAVPMIIDRGVDATTAMRTSLHVTLAELPAMLVWAALIVVLVGIGFATFLVGMIVIFPLLGHSTWQAYKDLVK